MTTNKLFSDKQFGFKSGRSTTLQLLYVLPILYELLDEGGTIDVIYCDIMKAFDKVPYRRLLFKIERYGITGNVHWWIKSFLRGRTQCVSINNIYSEPAAITSGMPQGSVLGPIHFVIHKRHAEVVDKDSQVFLFVDDAKVLRKIENKYDATQLQKDINNLVEWSDKWLLRSIPINTYSISQEICTRFCCALLCCGYAIVHNEFTWSIYPYSSGLLCWHWGNR